jgi:hypothetical protein
MRTCLNCGKPVFDAKEFISECRKNNLSVNENTLEITLSPGGMYVGNFSDYAQRLQEKERMRERAIQIQNKMAMFCEDCKKVYCLSCVSSFGKIRGNMRGCIACGGKMTEIREQYVTLKYGEPQITSQGIEANMEVQGEDNIGPKLNQFCFMCKKEWGPSADHCFDCNTSDTLVRIKKHGFFKKRIEYFDQNGEVISSDELLKMHDKYAATNKND